MASTTSTTLPNFNQLEKEQLIRLALAIDPVQFSKALGITPDPWQAQVLRSESNRIILNCSRQSGKSTIVAVLALYHALNTPNSLVLVVSHIYRQATETFRKIAQFYQRHDTPIQPVTENVHRLELQNGSRIITLSGQHPASIRGFSGPSLVIIDEAAQVLDEAYEESLRPMIAVSQGRLVLLSTPHGKRGFFWHAWEKENNWLKIAISADQCPRISKEYLAEEKELKPDWQFNQEYYGHFAEGLSNVFRIEDINRAFRPDIYTRDEIDVEVD
jgi:phage terminase large subunit